MYYKFLDILNKSNIYNSKNENKFFFFEKNQDELNYCNNYGLFIYDYFDGRNEYIEGNIGDYIQSLAALQYLPKNCIVSINNNYLLQKTEKIIILYINYEFIEPYNQIKYIYFKPNFTIFCFISYRQ